MPYLQNKITQAKSKLLVEYPYFGTLAARIKLQKNEDIGSFKSDGKELSYNSDFLKRISMEELEFVFANASMHAALKYEHRKNNRSGWLWQMASDYAINDMLVENGLQAPQEAHYDKRFHGMYTEEIYAELKSEMLRDDELEYEADNSDDVENNNKENKKNNTQEISKEELEEIVLEEKLFAMSALELLKEEKSKGEKYKSMERFFKLEKVGKINWRDELKSVIDIHLKDNYRLIPPNKKYLYMNIYLPSSYSERFSLVIAVDSSGSVDEELLNIFLTEINFLMSQVQNYEIEIIVCDDKIRASEVFYSGESLTCQVIGGGGTDFRPVFDYIKDKRANTRLLLYFTDLDGIFPDEEPIYDVKWITTKDKNPPFGELINLEER